MKNHQIVIDTDKCVGCGACAKTCVAHALVLQDQKARTVLNACMFCGQCVAVCPVKAVSISGYGAGPVEKTSKTRLAPQDVLDVIRFRRSIRQFQSKKIPQEVIEQILEAGRLTHTARNLQDVSFVVLDKEKDRIEQMAVRLFKRIKLLAGLFSPMARHNQIDAHFFFFKAPVVIVILAKEKTNGLLAAQNMEFMAEAHGLGVLFSGFFTTAANASRRIRKAIRRPKGKRVAMTLVLGYPDVRFFRSAQREALTVSYL